MRNSKDFQMKYMGEENKIGFCDVPNAAHIIHKNHHVHAVEYVLETSNTNAAVTGFEFYTSPSTTNKKKYSANWAGIHADERMSFKELETFLATEVKQYDKTSNNATDFAIQYDLTVYTCKCCNLAMTMEYWFRYHLYTNISDNRHRLIQSEKITISEKEQDDTLTLIGQFPTEQYDKKHDFFTAYIAYYMKMCLPLDLRGLIAVNLDEFKKTYLLLSWIVLEITCLLSEYRRGNQQSGKLKQPPRCFIGAIELYMSYFGYIVACYQNHNFSQGLSFKIWHQMYVWDIPGCITVRKGCISLFDYVRDINCLTTSKTLLEAVCVQVTKCCREQLLPLMQLFGNSLPVPNNIYTRHFVRLHEANLLMGLAKNTLSNSFDYAVAQVGIRAMWQRTWEVHSNIDDIPAYILKDMREFFRYYTRHEIKRMAKTLRRRDQASGNNIIKTVKNYYYNNAKEFYENIILDPIDRNFLRGAWTSAWDLYNAGAFMSSELLLYSPALQQEQVELQIKQEQIKQEEFKEEDKDEIDAARFDNMSIIDHAEPTPVKT
jgi:hypothetical protein